MSATLTRLPYLCYGDGDSGFGRASTCTAYCSSPPSEGDVLPRLSAAPMLVKTGYFKGTVCSFLGVGSAEAMYSATGDVRESS